MLVYLSTAYSQVQDKDRLMVQVLSAIAKLTEKYPHWHIVTPLFNHFVLPHSTTMGHSYSFWQNYSRELLGACSMLVVITFPGMDLKESVGVQDEINYATISCKDIIYLTSTEI